MSNSSIHIAPGASGYFAHNSRETWSKSQVFFDEENEISCTQNEAFEVYRNELKVRSEAYSNRTNQVLQKKAITHLSAIINLSKHHTLEDLQPLIKHLEDTLDTKVIQIVIHRDEGKLISKIDGHKLVSGEDFFANPKDKQLYFDEGFTKPVPMDEYDLEKNYHAHIEFMGLDSAGIAIKRNKLNKVYLQQLQTITAKSLGMERGQQTQSYTREQMTAIKGAMKPEAEYSNKTEYAKAFNVAAKELGFYIKKTKRLDTHDFKAKKKIENDAIKEPLATIKDLKAVNAELRAELQAKGATRADYAKLEAEVTRLTELVKAKELTIVDLKGRVYADTIKKVKNGLTGQVVTRKETHQEVAVREGKRADIAEAKVALLELNINDYDARGERIKVLERKVVSLTSENTKLTELAKKMKGLYEALADQYKSLLERFTEKEKTIMQKETKPTESPTIRSVLTETPNPDRGWGLDR